MAGKIELVAPLDGVVTIQPEDTASNFTVTIPAEAGDIVLETTADKAFKQSNILGTVSQSGGVPTGAIIERGSNANGEFVKYADGTMICTGSRSATVAANSSFTAINNVTYASAFIASPSVSVGLNTNYGNANGYGGVAVASGTNFRMYFINTGTQNTGTNTIGSFTAVGRWY